MLTPAPAPTPTPGGAAQPACLPNRPCRPAQLPFVDQGDPDEELANDPLGLKQLGKAFGFGKKQADSGDAQQGKRKGKGK